MDGRTTKEAALQALKAENDRLRLERDAAVAVSRDLARERDAWKVSTLRMRADCAHVE